MADPFHDIIERDLAIKCSADCADVLRRTFQLCSTQRGAVVAGVAGVAGAIASLTGAFYATYDGKIGDSEIDAFWRDLIRPIIVETFERASQPFTAMQADMAGKPWDDAASPETVDRVIGIVTLITGERSISRHHFLSDLGLDWHDRLSIACEIDELLGTSIPDQEIADWATIADIAATVDHLAPPLPLPAFTQLRKD